MSETVEKKTPEKKMPESSVQHTQDSQSRAARKRRLFDSLFATICLISAWFGVLVLAILLAGVTIKAWGWLDWGFISSVPRVNPEESGILPGIWGSFWLITITALFSIPLGVGAAIYLEEFASDNWLKRLVQVNLANLAGVPSVVYGILGLSVFVRMLEIPKRIGLPSDAILKTPLFEIPLPLGPTIIAGSLTMSLLVLPVIIVASQEAIRAVPASIRHAALALGATRWQTIRTQTLPAAIPGILTGIILAISRAIGETAPLLMIGTATYITRSPGGIDSLSELFTNPGGLAEAPFDSFTAMPMLIYFWIGDSRPESQNLAAAGILVLLAVLLILNSLAVVIRNRFQKHTKW